jgi:hypothetical protein
MARLAAIEDELASKRGVPVRWAFANKSEITTAVYVWSRDKMEALKKSEALAPEIEDKVLQYETLQSELRTMEMDAMRLRYMPRAPGSPPPAADSKYEALATKVAEAKAPVAAIVERRSRQAAQYREQYSLDRLVAEYVKGRYDLVVDTNEKPLYRSAGEVPDITVGVIAFFKEKATR